VEGGGTVAEVVVVGLHNLIDSRSDLGGEREKVYETRRCRCGLHKPLRAEGGGGAIADVVDASLHDLIGQICVKKGRTGRRRYKLLQPLSKGEGGGAHCCRCD